jgi:ADP-ribose pyrophosphatase YjhB (NUDIX family)
MIINQFLGKITYIFTYIPIRLLLLNTTRVYLVLQVDNKILVTKNWLGLHIKWRLPGGGLKKGEQSSQALIRECQEEIGLSINADDLVLITKTAIKANGYKFYLYKLNMANKPGININNQEIVQYDWLDLKTIPDKLCSKEVAFAKAHCQK